MKTLSCSTVLLAALLAATAVPGQAATLVVTPGQSIQKAIDAAKPGDIVSVRPGTYAEQITIDRKRNLQVVGAIVAGKRPVLDGTGKTTGHMVTVTRSAQITFRNFTVQKAPTDPVGPVYFDNIHVDDSDTVSILGNLITDAGGDGIELAYGHGFTVSGNRVTRNGGSGVAFTDHSAYSKVTGNTFSGNGADGVQHGYGNYDLISGNKCLNNGGEGISNEDAYALSILNNTVTGNASDGIYDDSYGTAATLVKGNAVTDNGGYGIYVYMASRVMANTVTGNASEGIYADYGAPILGNTVRDNLDDGIYVYEGFGAPVANNVVIGNGDYGIYLSYGYGGRVQANTVKANTAEGIFIDDDVALVVGNTAVANGDDGLVPYYDSVITKSNTSANNDGYGIYADDYGNLVQGNVVTGNKDVGIVGDYYAAITGNAVRNNQGDGINELDFCVVRSNTVTGNTGYGINASGYDGNYVRGNKASANTGGFDLYDDTPRDDWWIANTGTHNW